MVTILTKTGGWLEPINFVLGIIMNAIYEFFNLFGIQNIALTIIIFTFFVRALMLPLTIKQQKFTKMSSVMNPELQKIQAKYKGKKDQASLQKQQLETQAVYQKYGANPTSGCLPLLITLPIMFALYAVIYNIPAYVNQVRQLYEGIANQVLATPDYQTLLTTLAETIKNSRLKIPTDMTTAISVVDVLKYFTQSTWTAFATSFPDIQNSAASGSLTVAQSIDKLASINSFLGFNIANPPGMKLTPALIIPVLAGGLQYIQGKQISVKNKDMNQDNPMASTMNSMNIVMPIMSAFFCITFPIGVGIYWIASSVFAIIQQFFVNKYMDRVDVNDLIAKNVAKQKKKNAYLESKGISMSDLAKTQTKNIENTASEKVSITDSAEKIDEETAADNTKKTTASSNSKSISDIANLLKNKNDKGDK